MGKITNIVTPSAEQWYATIMGMRNPLSSWNLSDSKLEDGEFKLGDKDKTLALKLVKAGPSHRKFLRMLSVIFEADLPMYVLKELDTYKIGTTSNSCSTMHKLGERNLTLEDFEVDAEAIITTRFTFDFGEFLHIYNELMAKWRNTSNEEDKKCYWRLLVQWLPMSYKQKRTYSMNYEVLLRMLVERKNHKLREWSEICDDLLKNVPLLKEIYDAYNERRKEC